MGRTEIEDALQKLKEIEERFKRAKATSPDGTVVFMSTLDVAWLVGAVRGLARALEDMLWP